MHQAYSSSIPNMLHDKGVRSPAGEDEVSHLSTVALKIDRTPLALLSALLHGLQLAGCRA